MSSARPAWRGKDEQATMVATANITETTIRADRLRDDVARRTMSRTYTVATYREMKIPAVMADSVSVSEIC